ncbi:20755_t:CDS:1 [Racocetra persica]|uniref:20755_t:CDS:1 n=1 Tax=Racocetra persica TaxID=160502 RepID=A0ACA9MLF0_9GLOM|nr:20755_t:CDS:1 [Racocetra persica]
MANQMNKGKKQQLTYCIEEFVCLAVLKIDHFSVDHLNILCKIINKTDNNRYQLGARFRIIETYYLVRELEPLGLTTFSELDIILSNKISVREVAQLQSARLVLDELCNCKSYCVNSRCYCKKAR